MTPAQTILAQIDPRLLSAAVEAARRALRRMDDKHIPARLRDIAGRSGRLPAPLTKRLLAELDASEWLRAEALAEMPDNAGIDPTGDRTDDQSASGLFLERPEGWLDGLETIASNHRQVSEKSEVKRLETELRRALARAVKLEEQLSTAERKEHGASSGVEERLAAAAASHRRSQSRLKSANGKLEGQLAEAELVIARLNAENAELRQRVEEGRAERGKQVQASTPRKTRAAWSLNNPSDIARHLDDLGRAFAVAPALPNPTEPGPLERGSIESGPESTRLSGPPSGIRPDQAEAIVWMLSIPGSIRVAIDGWNAAHLLQSPPLPATRNRIIEAARRIKLASSGKRMVTAVFDSSQVGESFSADDVVVTFVTSADDELIAMANRDATRMVVITSDRRVREAVERAGAVGLWSEALIDWLRTAGRRTFKA